MFAWKKEDSPVSHLSPLDGNPAGCAGTEVHLSGGHEDALGSRTALTLVGGHLSVLGSRRHWVPWAPDLPFLSPDSSPPPARQQNPGLAAQAGWDKEVQPPAEDPLSPQLAKLLFLGSEMSCLLLW